MHDPFTWSIGLGRWFGIRVKVHFIFILFVALDILSALTSKDRTPDNFQIVELHAVSMALLFGIVLVHEFGHCFAARWVGGEASEILLWPLGGLATCSVANRPRDHFITAAGGPMVNVLVCAGTGAMLLALGAWPPLNPFRPLFHWLNQSQMGVELPRLFGVAAFDAPLGSVASLAAMTFYLSWVLLLFNLIPAFPLDGGRMFRCLLWPRFGFAQATHWAVQVGKVAAILMGLIGLIQLQHDSDGALLIGVAVFMYLMCEYEKRLLESGALFDDSVFGYDFSQGYTSLEKSTPKVKAPRVGRFQRWKQRRAERRRERQVARSREEESRVDAILAKLHDSGIASLTDEERLFLRRVSLKYKNRYKTQG